MVFLIIPQAVALALTIGALRLGKDKDDASRGDSQGPARVFVRGEVAP
jgi:hypothetical protein